MARVPSFKKVLKERIPSEYVKWMQFVLNPLNSFMEDVTLAFNKRLTIFENMDAEVKTVTVSGSYPIKLSWNRPSKPTIGQIGKIERPNGQSVSLSNAIFMVWDFNQKGEIEVSAIQGLDDSSTKTYKLTLVFWVG